MSEEIEFVIKILSTKKSQGTRDFSDEIQERFLKEYQFFKNSSKK